MASKALEINLECSRVDITVDQRYRILQEVMGKYHGVKEGLQGFLEEICHPYKNWGFIVKEARAYALNYFHVLKAHPKGPEAARLYMDIFCDAIESSRDEEVRVIAADNLLFFTQRVIKDAGAELSRFLPVLDYCFDRIRCYSEETFFLFAKSFYQLNRLGKGFSKAAPPESSFRAINRLLIQYYRYTYHHWLEKGDPVVWFEKESGVAVEESGLGEIFDPISHKQLKASQEELERIIDASDGHSKATLDRIIELPGYGQIVNSYSEIPQRLLSAGDGKGNQWRLIFLLHIMTIKGVSSIHEDTLRDINRTLAWLIQHEDPVAIQQSLEKTFTILRLSAGRFPGAALNCVLNMGHGVYKTDDSDLVDFFIDSVVSLGFQTPQIKGVGDDWQIRANTAHIQNIRTWLELIELKPKWSKKLLSSLIIHLSLSGVFIKDTDLFPRDITRLLNSDIAPIYNLVKQLTRLFPAYFNDLGAEGKLRDISSKIDEVCLRKDALIHFLRKQSHVESSNQIIGFMEAIFNFWKTKAKEGVRPFVPPNIYEQIETRGPYVDGVHQVLTHLFDVNEMRDLRDLLNFDAEGDGLKGLADKIPGVSDLDIERVGLAIVLYKLLYQKYHSSFTEIDSYLGHLQSSSLPDLRKLKEAVGEKDQKQRSKKLLSYLEKLKDLILSAEGFEIREDIYRKRHFTVDIPSMYGSYHEMKFDALGATFRLESLVRVLFEEMVERIDLTLVTRATFSQIYEYLHLFYWVLKLDGISSLEMERQLDLLAHSLEIKGFSFTQYLDIFRGFSQTVNNIVNDYFNNIHHENLLKIINQIPKEGLLSKYLPSDGADDGERTVHRVTEIFLRDRIASSLGLQQLDLFLSRVLNTLHLQADQLPKENLRLLLSYDPQKTITPISPTKRELSDIIHLGNKGLNLTRIKKYGLPVPPGFIITTEVFRCREIVDGYPPAGEHFKKQVALEVAALEKLSGKLFGDPHNPLLLSVRSGSSISHPGMMNSFLDVGINEEVVQGMIAQTKKEWFGWDTYRRFLQSYGMAFGLVRDDFDAIIDDFKQRAGIPYKKDFTGQQMREIALAYRAFVQDSNIVIEDSPFAQLHIAIRKVFDSWYSHKAKTYRKIMGISDDWGTAVTVQAMVFGNYSRQSGAGVFFTHSPRWSGDMVVLWGDFTPGNQGEDVVSGLVSTFPVSNKQAEAEGRQRETTLETMFPEIYHGLRGWTKELVYERKWSPQEMEFTFEGPHTSNLYFLQTRDMAIREKKKVYSFDTASGKRAPILGHGIGVSGGAMAGRVVFSLEEIQEWRKKEPETSLIIVRNDTVPDDIREIYEADGLLTARGGSTSHAAIVAHRLNKTCVVGCSNMACMEREGTCSLNHRVLKSGDWISIDGLEGAVYLGRMKIREIERD